MQRVHFMNHTAVVGMSLLRTATITEIIIYLHIYHITMYIPEYQHKSLFI